MRMGAGIAAFALATALAVGTPLYAQVSAPLPQSELPETGNGTGVAPAVIEAPLQQDPERVLPVMTLDQDVLYRQSAWGLRVQAELERRGLEIANENDRLAEQFSNEEQELTILRETLSAEEFRKRADEFDRRVVEVRREREEALRALQTQADIERTAFFRAILPALSALMQERGAVAILDQRAIFVAAESIDVTDDLIARINAEIGAGESQSPEVAPEDAGQGGSVEGSNGQE